MICSLTLCYHSDIPQALSVHRVTRRHPRGSTALPSMLQLRLSQYLSGCWAPRARNARLKGRTWAVGLQLAKLLLKIYANFCKGLTPRKTREVGEANKGVKCGDKRVVFQVLDTVLAIHTGKENRNSQE